MFDRDVLKSLGLGFFLVFAPPFDVAGANGQGVLDCAIEDQKPRIVIPKHIIGVVCRLFSHVSVDFRARHQIDRALARAEQPDQAGHHQHDRVFHVGRDVSAAIDCSFVVFVEQLAQRLVGIFAGQIVLGPAVDRRLLAGVVEGGLRAAGREDAILVILRVVHQRLQIRLVRRRIAGIVDRVGRVPRILKSGRTAVLRARSTSFLFWPSLGEHLAMSIHACLWSHGSCAAPNPVRTLFWRNIRHVFFLRAPPQMIRIDAQAANAAVRRVMQSIVLRGERRAMRLFANNPSNPDDLTHPAG